MTTTEPTEDIHALELDFAKRPNTDAFVPLCEAYLRQKRYMEAMLVCKKGIKNLPSDPRGRLLLARTYFEQGKPPKAEQELATLLEVFPDNIDALVMQSSIFKQGGRKSDAIAVLQRALTMQPGRSDLKDQLRGMGVADVALPPPQQMTQQPGMMMQPRIQQQTPVPQGGNFGVNSFFEEAAPVHEPMFQSQAQHREDDDAPRRPSKRKKKGGGGKITIAIIGVLLLGFGTFLTIYLRHVGNVKAIDGLVREARPFFEKATYVSYKQAIGKYNRILEIDPKSVFGLSISAYVHYTLAQTMLVAESAPIAEQMIAAAEAAGTPKDENQYRVAARGWRKIVAGDPKGALDGMAPEAPSLQSHHVYLTLAEAYAQLGEEANARESLSKATGIAATDNLVLLRAGEGNLDEGKYDQAKGYFDQLLNNEPGHPGALIGRVYANIGKKQESLEGAEKDIEKLDVIPREYLPPRWKAGVLWTKGLVDLRRGRPQDAQKNFEEALKIDPNNLRNLALRAKVYVLSANWPDAVKDYQTVLAKRPNQRPAQVGLALAYSTLGKSVEAGQIVEQLLAKDPNDAELQLVKARSLKAQGNYDDAVTAYQKVLSMQKSNFDAKIEIGQSLRLKKDYAQAATHLDALSKEVKSRNKAVAFVEYGRVYLDQGRNDQAKDRLIEAAKTDPDYADTYFFLAKVAKGKAQKEALGQYLKLAPAGIYAAEAEKLLSKK